MSGFVKNVPSFSGLQSKGGPSRDPPQTRFVVGEASLVGRSAKLKVVAVVVGVLAVVAVVGVVPAVVVAVIESRGVESSD